MPGFGLKAAVSSCEHLERLHSHIREFAAIMQQRRGTDLPAWLDTVDADDLPALHTLATGLRRDLEGTVHTNFDLGDYETASFAAMKAVEVAVRDACGLDNSLVGVRLMREAFRPHENGKTGGTLADAEAEGGEQTATANLFAGAMGAYKNPASHRTVDFDDPIEAAEEARLLPAS